MTGTAAGRLRLVVRSYGGENAKNRPPYYSKLLTLASVIRAAEAVPEAQVLFINDGPVPDERLALMERAGEVRQIAPEPQGLRASYLYALGLPAQLGWSDDDVVFFVEDDYLFTADAFNSVAAAIDGLPEASYFGVHGERPDDDDLDDVRRFSLPRDWVEQPQRKVGDDIWSNLASTTSTFGARVGALHNDLDVFRACMRPFRRRFLDHETCVMYQGYVPYHGLELLMGVPGDFTRSPRGVVRTLVLVPFRFALNALARRRHGAHYLYALTPNKATHMEYPVMSPDRDWEAEAASVARWAEAAGLTSVAERLQSSKA